MAALCRFLLSAINIVLDFSFHFKTAGKNRSYGFGSWSEQQREKYCLGKNAIRRRKRVATMMLLENNCNPITLSFFENLKALKNLYSHFMQVASIYSFSLSGSLAAATCILPLMFSIPLDLCICAAKDSLSPIPRTINMNDIQ
jgi:hypothetical protein